MKKYEPTYWNHNGKYQKLYEILYGSLVPKEGEADTTPGEILRIVSKVYYDIYNNGGWNFDTMSDDRDKLIELVPKDMRELSWRFVEEPSEKKTNNYMKFLDLYMDWAINYANILNVLSELEAEM